MILEIMICRVLAEAVQDNAERLCSDLVCGSCDTDSAFSSRKGLVTCEEAEALGLLAEKHCAEVAVAETDLAVFRNGAGDAERLQTDTDCLGSVGMRLYSPSLLR